MNTKLSTTDKILNEALSLFATHGYQGVSVEMIANSVGIKASSLYKHYKNKQSIFDSIFPMMKSHYKNNEQILEIPQNEKKILEFYKHIELEELNKISETFFLYYLEDEKEVKFRHLLTIEQYQDEKISQILYERYYLEPITFQTTLFQFLMDENIIVKGHANITALHFFAPIMALMQCCEQGALTKEEGLAELLKHVKQFRDLNYL